MSVQLTDDRKTSPVAPPSIALAMMAWTLAQLRVWGAAIQDMPVPRSHVEPQARASTEYYHILRRIEDGETP